MVPWSSPPRPEEEQCRAGWCRAGWSSAGCRAPLPPQLHPRADPCRAPLPPDWTPMVLKLMGFVREVQDNLPQAPCRPDL
ncbi:hypothetical protein EJB05_54667 [Eragrostis curvula]|uniref:Uncharacterized protein n=1 Tax=Eragrostis curvula TaxID=38414 RepID=A0A5J9SLT9_9POAL|nr:hypothetical protein EJB05_54667 [Eragrostis curvula]